MEPKSAVYRTRRKASRDSNQGVIEQALKAAGYTVVDTAGNGGGWCDLVAIDKTGRVYLIEVKREGDIEFTRAEVEFMAHLVNDTYRVICQPEQVGEYLLRE